MSKADEMFEIMAYEKIDNPKLKHIVYRSDCGNNTVENICFHKTFHKIEIYFYSKEDTCEMTKPISMQELQAINEKCKELRMDLKKEWKEIKGYEGKYIISNYGEIISLPRYKQNNSKLQYVEPKEIKRYANTKNGYVYVQLWNNSSYKNIRLHKLVAQAFIPNPENKPQINHIDGNKQNNRIDNLEWCTCKENINHAWAIGLINRKRCYKSENI